jgi:hypothetical protein
MDYYGNMGPLDPVSFKGNARINGVPTFTDKLPLRQGGIAGEKVYFGRVVSIDPSSNRREFKMGTAAGRIIKGISMLDPTIMRADPAQQNYYFSGRPMTITTLGLLDILEYDITKSAPMEGSTVWCRNSDGMLAFNDGTDISASGYTKLNAYVYETLDPNGAKVFFNLPLVTTQTRETVTKVATPTASPAAGAVASGTAVTLATTTANAVIHYTVDGTAPTNASPVFDPDNPIIVTANVTIKAVAVAEGYDPSSTLTAAYTIS